MRSIARNASASDGNREIQLAAGTANEVFPDVPREFHTAHQTLTVLGDGHTLLDGLALGKEHRQHVRQRHSGISGRVTLSPGGSASRRRLRLAPIAPRRLCSHTLEDHAEILGMLEPAQLSDSV